MFTEPRQNRQNCSGALYLYLHTAALKEEQEEELFLALCLFDCLLLLIVSERG